MTNTRIGIALVLLLGTVPAATAWGPVAHQAVIARAIDTLPGGIKSFYKDHRLEIPSLAPDTQPSEEGREQRFAVDRLLPFPFAELPRTEDALKGRFGDAAQEVGRLPWLIHESYGRLVEAMKAGDKTKILAESDTLARLVTDLENPLALSDNFDGQKTGQHGLWVRFTVKLPEAMGGRLKISSDSAHFLDDPKSYVFSILNAAYVWLDNLLYEEDLARRGASGYSEIYYGGFEARAGELLKQRLGRAAADVGSFWYTAWTAAGRPSLK